MLAIVMAEGIIALHIVHTALDASNTKGRDRGAMNSGIGLLDASTRNLVSKIFEVAVNHTSAKGGKAVKYLGHDFIQLAVGKCGLRRG